MPDGRHAAPLLAATGGRVAWTWRDAVGNLVLLLVMGSATAAGTLLIARRAGRSLDAGDPARHVGEGSADMLMPMRDTSGQQTVRESLNRTVP